MVSRVRNFVDSLLHSRRRRAALRRLTNANPRSILFVCQGNICRSPFAAALLAKLAPREFSGTIASAGFVGPGRPPPEHALTTARAYGLDMSGHRSSALTSASLQAADLLIVMSRDQEKGLSARVTTASTIIVLGDLDPLPIRQRTIHDPWDGPVEAFGDSYERINRCVKELVTVVWGGTGR